MCAVAWELRGCGFKIVAEDFCALSLAVVCSICGFLLVHLMPYLFFSLSLFPLQLNRLVDGKFEIPISFAATDSLSSSPLSPLRHL